MTNEFTLRMDILRAYDAAVDIGRQTLRLPEEEVLDRALKSSCCSTSGRNQ
jgi:hypothetical protein